MIEETFEQCVYRLLCSLRIHNDNYKYNGRVVVRCPFCGDSIKSERSTHMYVLLKTDNNKFPSYYCQRCKANGYVDEYFLDLLGLYDNNLSYLYGLKRTQLSKNAGRVGFKTNKVKELKLLPPLNNKITKEKISYVQDRLGILLTVKDIINYKMVLNLYDFLNYNKITEFTRHEQIMEGLDKFYIGFLSTRNEFINMRNIYDKRIDNYLKRYINYNIFGLDDNTKRFYTLSGRVNKFKRCKVVIAEGPFDIIGIHNHIYGKKYEDNIIFCAVQGIGYENLIKYLCKLGILFADYEIYSDKEVSLGFYKDLKSSLDYRVKDSEFTICYNTLSKDCGVTADKINIKKYKI